MRVDAPGLVAAAQRLIAALEALGGSGVPHPPLGADPASLVAAERLTTAGAELTAALVAHVAALVASAEVLTGAAITYLDTDDQNAAAIRAAENWRGRGSGWAGIRPRRPHRTSGFAGPDAAAGGDGAQSHFSGRAFRGAW